MKNKSYSVAVLGAGNIGAAVIERLENLDNEIVNIDLKSVLPLLGYEANQTIIIINFFLNIYKTPQNHHLLFLRS